MKFFKLQKKIIIFLFIIIFISISLISEDVDYYLNRAETYRRENKLNLAVGEYLKTIAKYPHNETAHLKLAELYIIQRSYDSAIDELNFVLTITKDEALKSAIYEKLGDLYFNTNNVKLGISSYNEALKIEPKKYSLIYKLGLYYLKNEDYLSAFEYLNKVKSSYYNNIDFLIKFGDLCYKLNKFNLAEEIYQRAAGYKNIAPAILKRLGSISYINKDYSKSINYLKNYLKYDSNDREVLKMLADSYEKKNDYENAFKIYEVLIKAEPNNYGYYYNLGLYSFELKKYDAALNYYIKAKNINSRDENVYWRIYDIYIEQKDYENGIKFLRDFSKSFPGNLSISVKLAKTFELVEKYDDAIKTYNSILEKDKNYKEALDGLLDLQMRVALKYQEKNETQKAIEQYNKIIELFPYSFNAYLELGKLYYKIKNYQMAIFFFEKGKTLKSDNQELNRLLGLAYYQNNDFEKSVAILEDIYSKNQKDLEVIRILSDIYFKMKDYLNSIKKYEEISKISPDDKVYYNLGILYEKIEDYQTAIQQYEKAQSLNKEWRSLSYKIGDLYLKLGKYPQSLSNYLKLVDELKTDANLFYQIGKIYFINNDFSRAIQYLENADKLNFKDDKLKFMIGVIYNKNKDFKKSIDYLEALFNSNPTFEYRNIIIKDIIFDSYKNYAVNLSVQNETESEKYFQNAKSINNADDEIYRYLSDIEIKRGNFDKALAYLWLGYHINPKNISIIKNYAESNYGKTNFDDAVRFFNEYYKYVKMSLDEYENIYKFALSYSHICDNENAIEIYKKLLSLKETDYVLLNISDEYYKIKNLSNALIYLKKYLNLHSTDNKSLDLIIKICIEKKDYKEALSFIDKILVLNVDRTYYKYLAGYCNFNLKNYKEAIKIFSTILNYNEKINEIRYYLGFSYYYNKDYKEAIVQFNYIKDYNSGEVIPALKESYLKLAFQENKLDNLLAAYSLDKNDMDLTYDIGCEYFRKGDYGNAKIYLLALDSQKSNFKDASLLLGKIFERDNDFQKALDYYEKYVSVKEDFDIINKIAVLSEKINNIDNAIKFYIKCWNLKPDLTKFLLKISELYEKKNDKSNSISYLKKYVEKNNKDIENLYKLATLYNEIKEFSNALRFLENIINIKPDYEKAYLLSAEIYYATNRYSKSFENYLKCKTYIKSNETIWNNISEIVISLKKFDKETEDLFLSGLNYFKNNNLIIYVNGLIKFKLNKFEESEKYFNIVKDFRDANDYKYRICSILGKKFFNDKRYAEAAAYNENAVKMNENDSEAILFLAKSLYQLQRFDEALSWLNRVEKQGNTDIFKILANIYFIKKDYVKSKDYYSKITTSDLNNEELYNYIYSLVAANDFKTALENIKYLKLDNIDKVNIAEKIYLNFNDKENLIKNYIVKLKFVSGADIIRTKIELVKLLFAQERWSDIINYGGEIYNSTALSSNDRLMLAYFLGKSNLKIKKEEEALRYYRNAIPPLDEYKADVFLDYANLLNKSKDYVLAFKYYEEFYNIKKDDKVKKILGDRAELLVTKYYNEKKNDEAKTYFKKAIDYEHINDNIRYLMALILYSEKNYDEAVEKLLQISSNSNYYKTVLKYLIEIYELKNDYNNAFKYSVILTEIEKNKSNFEKSGDFAYKINNFIEAEKYYTAALNEKKDYNIFEKLGNMYYANSQIDSAIYYYTELYGGGKKNFALANRICELYLNKGDTINAIIYLQETIILNPQEYKNYLTLANLWKSISNPAQAIMNYKKYLDKDSSNKELYRTIADEYNSIGRYDKAIENYLIYLNYEKPDDKTYFALAKSYKFMGDIPKATEYLNKCLELNKNYGPAFDLFAQINYESGIKYFNNGKFDDAIEFFLLADKYSKNYLDLNFYLAKIFYRVNNFSKAKEYLLNYLAKKDFDYSALLFAGDIYAKLNDIKTAEEYFSKALSLGKTIKNSTELAADFYFNFKKDYNKVIELINNIETEALNRNEKLLFLISNSYYLNNDFNNAIKYFNIYNKLTDKSNNEIIFKLANSYFNIQDFANAEKYYKALYNIGFKDAVLNKNLGQIYFKNEKYKDAVEQFKHYIEFNKTDFEINYNLALSYFKLSDFKNASEYFKLSISLQPNNALLNYQYAISEYNNKNFDNALLYFQNSEKLGITELNLFYYIGKIYFEFKKDFAKSFDYFEKLLKLDITTEMKKESLEYLEISAFKINNFNQTLNYSDVLLKLEPSNFIGLFYRSQAFYKLSRIKEALETLVLIKDVKDKFEYNLFAGRLYNKLQQPENSLNYLLKAMEINNKNIECLNEIGYSYYLNNNPQSAVKYLDSSLALQKNYEAYKIYGMLKNKYEKKYNDALFYFNEAKKISDTTEINYLIAEVYSNVSDMAESIRILKNIISARTDDIELKRDISKLLVSEFIELGFYNEAINTLNTIDKKILDEKLVYYLGLAHFYAKDYAASETALKKYIDVTKDADYLNLYSILKFRMNETDDAVKYLNNAITLKDDLKYYLNLSKIYEKSANIIKAIEVYNTIINKDKDNFDAFYNMGKLMLPRDKDSAKGYLKKAFELTESLERKTEIKYLMQQ